MFHLHLHLFELRFLKAHDHPKNQKKKAVILSKEKAVVLSKDSKKAFAGLLKTKEISVSVQFNNSIKDSKKLEKASNLNKDSHKPDRVRSTT